MRISEKNIGYTDGEKSEKGFLNLFIIDIMSQIIMRNTFSLRQIISLQLGVTS